MYSGWPPVSSRVIRFNTSPGWYAIELASVTAASTILLKVDKLESLTELLKRLVKNCLMADCCGLGGLYRLMAALVQMEEQPFLCGETVAVTWWLGVALMSSLEVLEVE